MDLLDDSIGRDIMTGIQKNDYKHIGKMQINWYVDIIKIS
jgi:hypothetical protein